MTKLSRSDLFKAGKVYTKVEESKSFIKHLGTINNQYIDLKIVNAMIEDNIYINIVDNTIKQSHIQKLRTKNKQIQIRIILNGKLEKLNHRTNEKRVYTKNEISLEYEENVEESLLNKQGQHLKYICITLDEGYINENDFFYQMFENTFSKKIYEPNLHNRFKELFDREYSSGLDKIYLKNKTMEMILYVLEEFQKKEKFTIDGFDDEDIKRVKQAQEILKNYFHEKITIPKLAKKVALNQSKLKKGFKELSGKTIHEYLKDVRLEKAVEYLKANKYSIKEVSLMVGYTNQGSFSYAFSNKFNCLPKDI